MRLPTYSQLSRSEDRALNVPLDTSMVVDAPPGSLMAELALYRMQSATRRSTLPSQLIVPDDTSRDLLYSPTRKMESQVGTWSQWFSRYWYAMFDDSPPESAGRATDWISIFARLSEADVEIEPSPVVVLNGQRLSWEAFSILQLVHEPVWVFAHERQRITAEGSTLDEIACSLSIDEVVSIGARNTREIDRISSWFASNAGTGRSSSCSSAGSSVRAMLFAEMDDLAAYVARQRTNSEHRSIAVFLPSPQEQLTLWHALKHLSATCQVYIPGFSNREFEEVDVLQDGIFILPYEARRTGLTFDHVVVGGFETAEDWWEVDAVGTDLALYELCASALVDLDLVAIGAWPLLVLESIPLDLIEKTW